MMNYSSPEIVGPIVAQGGNGWKINKHEGDLLDVFEASELIYMSPDAELELETVDDDKVYVIGGIIDRTIVKVV